MMNHWIQHIEIGLENSFLTNKEVIHRYHKIKAYQTEYDCDCIESYFIKQHSCQVPIAPAFDHFPRIDFSSRILKNPPAFSRKHKKL